MTEQLQFPTGSRTVHHPRPTSVIHLDKHTREIGRAGVADARAILAACAPKVLGEGSETSGCHGPLQTGLEEAQDEGQGEKQDSHLDEGAIDGPNAGLPAAA
ncbi:MAG: hypothetical protein VYD11_05620 [Actinomycetota bacterium]|nr:hypothetical protein [Acidimicrobiales bacterium]MED5221094.1 hypothetical protein [Actinomycetota bacterium]